MCLRARIQNFVHIRSRHASPFENLGEVIAFLDGEFLPLCYGACRQSGLGQMNFRQRSQLSTWTAPLEIGRQRHGAPVGLNVTAWEQQRQRNRRGGDSGQC